MRKFLFAMLLIGIMGIWSYLAFSEHEGFDITIKNQTNNEVSGLYLTYYNITSDIKIPTILPGKQYKLNITPSEDFGENSMKLTYKDQKGQLHTENVFGYFEKGYSGDAIITLESINDGKIQIKVNKKMFN